MDFKEYINLDYEFVVLGVIMNNNNEYYNNVDILSINTFSDVVCKDIFKNIKQRLDNNEKISIISMNNFFKDNLKNVGGISLLQKIQIASIGVFSIKEYVNQLNELATKRDLLKIENTIQQAVKQDGSILDTVDNLQVAINDISSKSSSYVFSAINGKELVQQRIQDIINKKTNNYVLSGFEEFDKVYGGFPKKALTILAGRPSMGKSTLALDIAINLAKQHKYSLFFSQEMNKTELSNKIISNLAHIELQHIQQQKLTEEDKLSLLDINMNILDYIIIDDKSTVNSRYIRNTMNKLKQNGKMVDLIIVDHLQIAGVEIKGKSRINELGDITTSYKNIAKDYNCSFLLLSQLSRACEERDDKRPQLSDLRESGEIEQNADLIIFVFRAEYYLERELQSIESSEKRYTKLASAYENSKNKLDLLIKKNRNGSCAQSIRLNCYLQYSIIED